ncbi:hypothetical protein N0V90_001915 [Kalmusia sp. IMI 367209]|nr:hypothetical protein N0V90_001915 [Kalmusia sp. IMI 367209]
MSKTSNVPQPPGYPFLGNLFDIDMEFPLQSLYDLADKHGELYRMKFPGHTFIIAASYDTVAEFCDEKRFPKTIFALKEMRHAMHDGLFTAIDGQTEPNWGIAHRILVPAFGPASLRNMYDGMYDMTSQLAMKWARFGKNSPITVTDDMTRLTLDVIALCSMDFRFNSYYRTGTHPFVEAMTEFLVESGDRARRLPIPSWFYRKADKKFFGNIDVMRNTAREILQERKGESEKELYKRKDLLSAMLNGVDPKTGQKMTEESILDNLITFLIAGHETTAGMLSFAMYHVIKNPEIYRKLQKEVDEVCGQAPIKFEQLSKLPYIAAVLRETLRLTPPLPVFNVAPKKDEIVGGKYVLKAEELVIVLVGRAHLDPKVYGEDVLEFRPERMTEENFDRLNRDFPNAWKPFGNGTRGCIGRPFAWQEAVLVLAMLFQSFDFELDDPTYTLKIKQTLTVKPANFQVRATPRFGLNATDLEHRLAGTLTPKTMERTDSGLGASASSEEGQPISIYYGSNSGTCQSMAERLAANAFSHGFRASVVEPLDNAIGKLPTSEPVAIITASYEGQPPDNAAQFVPWLENLKGEEVLKDVSYAIFGCGNRDWTSTFHRIPKLVDSAIEKHGGFRIAPIGLSDISAGNELTDFEIWEDEVFWPALIEKYDAVAPEGPGLSIEVTNPRKSVLHQDVREASVVSSHVLTSEKASGKKQRIEVQLPSDMTYKAGDYLAVLPVNPRENVHKVMRKFHLPWDAHLTISANGRTSLPNSSIPAADIFGSYVELAQPATKRNLFTLIDHTPDMATKGKLQSLASNDEHYTSEIVTKRLSVLDLLESNPSIVLPISSFLSMLPPLRVRQYSISSSPLWNQNRAVLTYSVLDEPCLAGEGKRHIGVASNYLSSLKEGDAIHVSIRPSHAAFHLPADTGNTPVIMVGAGAGIAPFRGFIQERAGIQGAGRKVAPGLLYFGCREPGKDDLYREDLDKWESSGIVSVRRTYSRKTDDSDGCKYVQHRLWKERDEVIESWDQGAQLYICGNRAVGEAVKGTFVDIFFDAAQKQSWGMTREEVKTWFEGLKNTRYAIDVFD